jgi:hypothetical protein
MKNQQIFKYFLLFLCCTTLSSCYTTATLSEYKGNVHQQAMGKTKNEVLRIYGPPDNTTDDGAGGTILMYEKYSTTTITNAGAATYGGANTIGAAIYGSGGIIGGSQTRGGAVSTMSGYSQKSTDKTYCYLYLNSKNVVYDFKTNYGAQYDYKSVRCFDGTMTWACVCLSALTVYGPIITVPWAIIAQSKARKKGELCRQKLYR